MKSWGDWVQDIADRNRAEEPQPPDETDVVAEGSGNLYIGWMSCPHCGYDVMSEQYADHVVANHPGKILSWNEDLLDRVFEGSPAKPRGAVFADVLPDEEVTFETATLPIKINGVGWRVISFDEFKEEYGEDEQ